jgi:DNA-binding GntR family transcriptional regulator
MGVGQLTAVAQAVAMVAETIDSHRSLLAALKRASPEEAADRIRAHIRSGKGAVLREGETEI